MTTNISARLKDAMASIGINAQELSERSGVGKSSISQYVHGKTVPNNISAAKLAAVLHVNPVWLMGFDVPMTDDPLIVKKRPAATAYHLEGQEDLTPEEKAQVEEYIQFILSKRK